MRFLRIDELRKLSTKRIQSTAGSGEEPSHHKWHYVFSHSGSTTTGSRPDRHAGVTLFRVREI